jgi:hypothetical protein
MAGGSRKAREISLGDGFGDVAAKVNGVRIEVHADGSVDAYTEGAVQVVLGRAQELLTTS